MPLLEIDNLTVKYGKAVALQDVSLSVGEHEVVSIVGANGAGKTTLLRTISGLKKAVSGEIRFGGEPISSLPPHKILRMGIVQVPAGRMIVGPMTVMDNMRVGAYARRDRQGINQDFETVFAHFPRLKERRSQLGGQLSGGEQQMLAVARALMARPKILLMDEPSIGLSPLMVAEVGNIIRDISESGISIVLVEQNCRMALRLAQRAYILELGHVAMEGAAGALAEDERVRRCYLGGI